MAKVHDSVCCHHLEGKSLSGKILKVGYYWPMMKANYMKYVQKCKNCQRFAQMHQAPPEEVHSSDNSWPFCKWGMDLLGPFPKAIRQQKYLIVIVDHFTN